VLTVVNRRPGRQPPGAGRQRGEAMQRTLIGLGLLLLVGGLLWPWLSHLPLGRLPGDLVIERPPWKMYFPITRCLLLSLLLSLLFWLFRK
jgi:hypothetical protein